MGDPAFFPRGSAWAIDANAGLSVGMRGPFSLRFLADYGRTRYGLRGSSAYAVTGATDAYLGGRAVMRVAY